MLTAGAGFLSLLSHARTRRVDKNWGRVYPDKLVGHDVQLHLQALADDRVEAVTGWCRALTRDLRARGATAASLQWRAGDQNHRADLLATSG